MPSELIQIDRAREIVLKCVTPVDDQTVPLSDALGRVLSRDVRSERPVPPFDSSAMDGFALRSGDADAAREHAPVDLELVGESRAGHPLLTALGPGQAAAISTGAVIPDGADAVVPLER